MLGDDGLGVGRAGFMVYPCIEGIKTVSLSFISDSIIKGPVFTYSKCSLREERTQTPRCEGGATALHQVARTDGLPRYNRMAEVPIARVLMRISRMGLGTLHLWEP